MQICCHFFEMATFTKSADLKLYKLLFDIIRNMLSTSIYVTDIKSKHCDIANMVNQVSNNPHGKGDPNDLSLRKVEVEVLIPKIMRDRAKQIYCKDVVAKFESCCKSSGIKMVFSCRQQTADLKECLTHWYNNEAFKEECKQIYLQERSNYRSTGIPKREKMQRM